jgi:hypothetical protein
MAAASRPQAKVRFITEVLSFYWGAATSFDGSAGTLEPAGCATVTLA